MSPGLAGLIEAILQDNPIVGIYELGRILLKPKTWKTLLLIGQPIIGPIYAVNQLQNILGLVGDAIDSFQDDLCGFNGCDKMMFARARLDGAIGMVILDFVLGGKGVNALRKLIGRGIRATVDKLGKWAKRLRQLDKVTQENFWDRLGRRFNCPVGGLRSTDTVEKSGGVLPDCDDLQDFLRDFDNLPEGEWDKFFKNPDMIDVWIVIRESFDSVDDFVNYIKRFPDPDANPAFYQRLEETFFDDAGDLIDPDTFKAFLEASTNPELAAILLRADGLGLEAWDILNRNGRIGVSPHYGPDALVNKPDALAALIKLRKNPRLAETGMTDDFLGSLLRMGWSSPPAPPSYSSLLNDIDEFLNLLPNNVNGLDDFFGAKGFGNAHGNTRRHSYVQLQRLLKNKAIFAGADEVSFEVGLTHLGNSEIDVLIRDGDRVITIETKAGNSFFGNITSSQNFATQTGNGIIEASSIQDFKVFVNPNRLEQWANNPATKVTARDKVVDAWFDSGILGDPRILEKFSDYFGSGPIADANELAILLRSNMNWFDEIFINDITP